MPIGLQRFNVKKTPPNPHIVFIKPLKGPDEATAQSFLERIAAQCVPIMREHSLSVMTVEEFPPNREFVGRNFNAGEVIQLVLRARSGHWLPFSYVQMVMMHELAHCVEMNHSRAFWAVRGRYADRMRELWGRGYTGEGIWGRGAALGTGEWEGGGGVVGEEVPEHLCGGAYRSRRKRKNGKEKEREKVSYKERKERRVRRKFGEGGTRLGADEDVKRELEGKGKGKGRPRVAGSVRGRELRAAAALARFEQSKAVKQEEEEEEGSEQEESEEEEEGEEEAVDVDGKKLVDGSGRGMVRVCGGDDGSGEGVGEMDELRGMFASSSSQEAKTNLDDELRAKKEKSPDKDAIDLTAEAEGDGESESESESNTASCSMCSFANPPAAVTCGICANVLDASRMPNAWRCGGAECRGSTYRNAGDCGVCGLCGQRRAE